MPHRMRWIVPFCFAVALALFATANASATAPANCDTQATAALQPAGGIILPPTATPSSASGCSMSDFSGFVPGRIALIQRGTCFFGIKVQNAQAAGATGVVIFNEGNPTRTDLLVGSLSD